MRDQTSRRRIVFAALLAASAFAISACGAAAVTEASVTTQASPVRDTTSSAPVEDTADSAPSAAGILVTAVQETGSRYAFVATVTVDGTETTRADGKVFDGIGEYLVTSGDRRVEYITSADGQWARQEGGTWTRLSGPAPLADPLRPLAEPNSAAVVSIEGTSTLIEAIYNGSVLGFVDRSEVSVIITVVEGALAEIEYEAPVAAGLATVITTFDASVETAPIELPSG